MQSSDVVVETTLSCDVVVVGGGGAGLAAAVEAAQLGGKVILIEKNESLGGTTARSIGSISASRTSLQHAAGITDSVESHFADMGVFAGEYADRDNLVLRRVFVENSGPTLEWLLKLGVAFFGPMPEPPHTKPRMHNVLPNSRAYIYHLRCAAVRSGVEILTRTNAVELLREKEGSIAGLLCETSNGRLRILASGGVILAAGDFSSSEELKRQCVGEVAAAVPGINPTSTGDGICLGLSVGGRIVNGDLVLGPELRFRAPSRKLLAQHIPPVRLFTWFMRQVMRWMPDLIMRPFVMAFATANLAPSPHLFQHGAILVDVEGTRFTDENQTPWLDLPQRPQGVGFIVFDSRIAKTLSAWPNYISTAPGIAYAFLDDYRRNRKDIYHHGVTIKELTRNLPVPAEVLERTIDSIGRGSSGEKWKAPYTALGPVESWIVLTEGGLAVNARLQVVDVHDKPIEGLYAAGSNGQGGLLLSGHGNHIGWAIVSGRIAAQTAFERAASRRK